MIMKENNIQIQDSSKRGKANCKLLVVISFITVIAIVAGVFWGLSSRQSENGVNIGNEGDPTIIPDLQHAVDSLLNAELTEINGLQGQVIVMEVQTGQLLAMSGLERDKEGKFIPCKNFAYQQELGSLTKTASVLALLKERVDTTYVIHTGAGIWEIEDGWYLRDHNWRRGGYMDINLSRALEVSSNIGVGYPVWKFYKEDENKFFEDLDEMSFGQPDFIEGIEGLKPTSYISPKDSNWIDKEIIWSAIGYNRKIAPIQMLTFYNAIANDGKMVKPTQKTGEIEIINPQIASKSNIKTMQTILEHVVSQGLGKKAGSPFFRVAGKTGTSIVNEYDNNEESGEPFREYQVAFCGYFPADKPKYSMIVSMNKMGLPASGGGMAGVLFHNITEWMTSHDMPKISL